ncbi:Protein of unknown function, partial [Gryllus bimaculatus]
MLVAGLGKLRAGVGEAKATRRLPMPSGTKARAESRPQAAPPAQVATPQVPRPTPSGRTPNRHHRQPPPAPGGMRRREAAATGFGCSGAGAGGTAATGHHAPALYLGPAAPSASGTRLHEGLQRPQRRERPNSALRTRAGREVAISFGLSFSLLVFLRNPGRSLLTQSFDWKLNERYSALTVLNRLLDFHLPHRFTKDGISLASSSERFVQ